MKQDFSWRDNTTPDLDKIIDSVLEKHGFDLHQVYALTFDVNGIKIFLNIGAETINVNYLDFKEYL